MRSRTSSPLIPSVVADMTHGLTVATVEREGDANFLGIVAGDLEAVRTPAQVRLCDANLAVMAAFFMGAGMLTKKVNTHDAVDALAVDRLTPFGDRLTAQNSPDTPIAVGGHVGDHRFDIGKQPIFRQRRAASTLWCAPGR